MSPLMPNEHDLHGSSATGCTSLLSLIARNYFHFKLKLGFSHTVHNSDFPSFLSVEILIIIIGRLRRGAINISSAATE